MLEQNPDRLVFYSMIIPNSATERVAEHFDIDTDNAQEIVAQMLGHDSWNELTEATATAHKSAAPDEFSTELEQESRVSYQGSVLGRFLPFTEPILLRKALALRVSALDSKSDQLAFDGYRRNTLLHWQCATEPKEWRFMPSERSYEVRESLCDLCESWQQQRLNFGEYENQIVQILQKQPENLAAYLYLFTAIEDINHWEIADQYISAFEKAINSTMPSDYPRARKSDSMIWGTIENRDFLRAVYYLAVGAYALKKLQKAKTWFLFLTRSTNQEIGLEKAFLADLREDQPSGDVYLQHDKY